MQSTFYRMLQTGSLGVTNKLVWAVDDRFNLTYTSPSFSTMYKSLTGTEPQCGMSLLDQDHRDYFWCKREGYERSLQGEDVTYEYEYSVNGEPVCLEICHCPIGVGQQVAGVLAIADNITERKSAEEALLNCLNIKDMCLREAHHRIQNNFQILESLFRLQANHSSAQDSAFMFHNALNRVKTMSLIHKILSNSEDLSTVNFGEFLRMLSHMLVQSYRFDDRVIMLQLDIDDLYLGTDLAVPCGMIANELISNALKHAFARQRTGKLEISLNAATQSGNVMTIKDNGMGLPRGLDVRRTDTLGMNIVCSLLRQIDAELMVNREDGTEFAIMFKDQDN